MLRKPLGQGSGGGPWELWPGPKMGSLPPAKSPEKQRLSVMQPPITEFWQNLNKLKIRFFPSQASRRRSLADTLTVALWNPKQGTQQSCAPITELLNGHEIINVCYFKILSLCCDNYLCSNRKPTCLRHYYYYTAVAWIFVPP